MTPPSCTTALALGLVVGGLVAAGVLGGAAWGTRAQPAPPRFEIVDMGGGVKCVYLREITGASLSCLYWPEPVSAPPRPGAW